MKTVTLHDLLTVNGKSNDEAQLICDKVLENKVEEVSDPVDRIIVDAFLDSGLAEGNEEDGWDNVVKDLNYAQYLLQRVEAFAKSVGDKQKEI